MHWRQHEKLEPGYGGIRPGGCECENLIGIANKVSKGDMTEKVEVSSSDEIGDLAESFKRMINAFKMMEAMSKEDNTPPGR